MAIAALLEAGADRGMTRRSRLAPAIGVRAEESVITGFRERHGPDAAAAVMLCSHGPGERICASSRGSEARMAPCNWG